MYNRGDASSYHQKSCCWDCGATSQLFLSVSDANILFVMSCTKTWVCLEMTPASLQLQKRCDRETEDHRAKTLNASAYPFIEISSQLKMQITRNVWVRKQTITFWFWFLSLNLTLPTQRTLPARLLGLCVRGEPAWNHFFKFLWPKRKKTPAVLVWMHADKAQKPQQLPTLKAVFSVYTGKFSLQLTRLLFSFFFPLENWPIQSKCKTFS